MTLGSPMTWIASASPLAASASGVSGSLHYLAAGLVSGLTFVASDTVAQLFLRQARSLQWLRLARVGMFGFAVKGPLQSLYYNAVEVLLPSDGTLLPAVFKMALDLLCFSPFVNILFLLCIPLLEGRTLKVALRNVSKNIIEVQRAAFKFWVLAHAANYSLITPPYRVVYVNFMGFMWTVILCLVAHNTSGKQTPPSLRGSPAKQLAVANLEVDSPPRLLALKSSGRSQSDHADLAELLGQGGYSPFCGDPLKHRSFAALHISPLKLPPEDVETPPNGTTRPEAHVKAGQVNTPGHGRTWTLGGPLQNIITNQLPEIARIYRKDSGPCM
mmetsp:Transcript_7492/g.18984  ORF Transcript_7492/g.18984 Transcript_7492/m.18984 type:complete len:329 (-) Transcript_7492:78-1064(-)